MYDARDPVVRQNQQLFEFPRRDVMPADIERLERLERLEREGDNDVR